MEGLDYLKNFEFTCCRHTRFMAHVAFEHANGKAITKVAIEFGIPPHHVKRYYRRICNYIYRLIGWHINHCDEFSAFEKTIILCSMGEVLHDTTFKHPIGVHLIEKYYLYICEQEKNNPEQFKNWLDESEKKPESQDEINRKKVDEVLSRLKTRHERLIQNAKEEYDYITNLIKQIIEPKPKPQIKPRYNIMASQILAAQEEQSNGSHEL